MSGTWRCSVNGCSFLSLYPRWHHQAEGSLRGASWGPFTIAPPWLSRGQAPRLLSRSGHKPAPSRKHFQRARCHALPGDTPWWHLGSSPHPASCCSRSITLPDKPPWPQSLTFWLRSPSMPSPAAFWNPVVQKGKKKHNNLPKEGLGVWNQQDTLLQLGGPCVCRPRATLQPAHVHISPDCKPHLQNKPH